MASEMHEGGAGCTSMTTVKGALEPIAVNFQASRLMALESSHFCSTCRPGRVRTLTRGDAVDALGLPYLCPNLTFLERVGGGGRRREQQVLLVDCNTAGVFSRARVVMCLFIARGRHV